MEQSFRIQVGASEVVFSTGKLAKQASAAVLGQHGETSVLVAVNMTPSPREGLDFFPLLVDYEERYYAAGKIPGGFIKREGRPSETAILSARCIDRSIRSLFPDHMRNDVHVVATVMSVDQKNAPRVLAINAASMALMLSDIPWGGPVGAVRMGLVNGELVVNPTEKQMDESRLDLLVAGHGDGITMVEAGAGEVSEEIMVEALEQAHQEIRRIVALQLEAREAIGKAKIEVPPPPVIPEIDQWLESQRYGAIREAVKIHEKKSRQDAVDAVRRAAQENFAESFPNARNYIGGKVESLVERAMRTLVLEEGFRSDGRALDQVRPITCEVDVLPRVHGSALFTRGETQSLGVTTLGMVGEDDQILDGLKIDEPAKRFMLHYNFPPFSVGEVRPMRGPGRREIGHGALAERAIRNLMPTAEEFPYAVRVVSDILESNGSSSMASVCSGSLSLMAAGVPVHKACAGVAMGLIKEGDRVAVLTDIQGLEDHYGDMDFKVAGTRDGITALQMDNKAGGITRAILEQALAQARRGRMEILDVMDAAISEPRKDLSAFAPRITTIQINPEKIRDIIGPGGKIIRNIVATTGAKVDVEDSGRVLVASADEEAVSRALAMIHELVREVQVGEVFVGKVVRMVAFGAFVELLPGRDGLLHVSEIGQKRVEKPEDVFALGDPVLVLVKEIDDMGRVNVSRKKALADAEKLRQSAEYNDILALEADRDRRIEELPAAAPRRPEGSGGERSGDRDRHSSRSGGGHGSGGAGRPPRRP